MWLPWPTFLITNLPSQLQVLFVERLFSCWFAPTTRKKSHGVCRAPNRCGVLHGQMAKVELQALRRIRAIVRAGVSSSPGPSLCPNSPECLEVEFSELPMYRVLGSCYPQATHKQHQRYAIWGMCPSLRAVYATLVVQQEGRGFSSSPSLHIKTRGH